MITSGRRPNRPDGAEYRRLRRQGMAGRTLLEVGNSPSRRRGGVLRAMAQSLTFLAQVLRRRR